MVKRLLDLLKMWRTSSHLVRSRSELANKYEAWAAENESSAKKIIDSLRHCTADVLGKQVELAIVLSHEAQVYRRDAASLRASCEPVSSPVPERFVASHRGN